MSTPLQLLAAVPAGSTSMWPFAILGICLVTIVVLVTVVRLHAFFALVLVALLAGILTEKLPGERGPKPATTEKIPAATGTASPTAKEAHSHWVQAAELTTEGFGNIAAKIGVVIALASVIGTCLVESGGADKVVRRFLALFGEKRAGHGLFASSYLLSIPIFFETFFMLLLPLARGLHLRTGRNYMLFVLAICCGGTVTHSLVAPHPGPMGMAANLHLDVGKTIVAGIVAGIIPALMGWTVAMLASRRINAPMRDLGGSSAEELRAIVTRPEAELPSLAWSLAPVLAPVLLIGGASFAVVFKLHEAFPRVFDALEFLGNRNVALVIGAALAIALLMRQRGLSLAKVSERIAGPFATAGVIILISSAGGAFGFMLKNAGVGDAIKALVEGREISFILLAWTVSAVIRIAQGSATVAMLTTSSMIYPLMHGTELPYNPLYIFLAIGFGSKILSWMNDSGFWTVSKLSGFTEKETLQSWTLIVTTISVSGLILTLVCSALMPFK